LAERHQGLEVVREQLRAAIGARKCHPCGCLHGTLAALEATNVGRGELAGLIAEARAVAKPTEYDCLGCAVCYPALATNAVSEAFPEVADRLAACPTDVPADRQGWPPLPGDYHVVRYRAPVAICALNEDDLARRLAGGAPEALAVVGTLRTENLGIERIIRNVLANPNVRFLVLCGEDTRQAIGHLPGQSLESLFAGGIDERGRIRGARGKRPVLQNVTADEVNAFLRQVEPVALIGESREPVILQRVAEAAARDPGPFEGSPVAAPVDVVHASEPDRLVSDPAGFVVVYPDAVRRRLVVEHYSNAGVLDCVVEGTTPTAVYTEVITRNLLSRLDHAAYLGRELTRADRCLGTGERYVQDRAPGEPLRDDTPQCGCSTGADCGQDVRG
jgi:tetrahydromethanopterin S-methyltransferase subunit A